MNKSVETQVRLDEPGRCPRCGSRQTSRRDYDYGDTAYYDFRECEGCGQLYTDVYEYKHTEWFKG